MTCLCLQESRLMHFSFFSGYKNILGGGTINNKPTAQLVKDVLFYLFISFFFFFFLQISSF